MTKREVTNKYFPQLIMIMKDQIPALQLIRPWAENVVMKNIIDNVPNNIIPSLWQIIKQAKYKEDPKPILDALQKELKEATD